MTVEQLKDGDDGRLLYITKFTDGRCHAVFNTFPYKGWFIEEDVYEEFKERFCDLTDNVGDEFLQIAEQFKSKKPEEL